MMLILKLKRPEEKESALYLEFRLHKQRFKFYPGKTVQTKNWSSKRQEVMPNEPEYKVINEYLENWKGEIKKVLAEKEQKNEVPTNYDIQDALEKRFKPTEIFKQETNSVTDFISFIDNYIMPKKIKKMEVQKLEQTKKLVLLAFNLITPKNLNKWEKLSICQKSKSKIPVDRRLPFSEINLKFIQKFRDFLYTYTYKNISQNQEVVHYKVNYIDKLVKGLKQVINAAIEEGYVSYFRWTSIKSEERQVDSVYTDFEEIRKLYTVQLTNPMEILVRDKYVLNCFLGLRYSDLNSLEPHLFKHKSIAGKEYIIYSGRAHKTDQKVEFALHPLAISILDKYQYNLPKLTCMDFNRTIKVVARKSGLTQLERIREIRGYDKIIRDIPKCDLLTSHAGRRSFCTNFYHEGVSIGAIMNVSGHSTEEEFRKYIRNPSVRLDVVADQIMAIQAFDQNIPQSNPSLQLQSRAKNQTDSIVILY